MQLCSLIELLSNCPYSAKIKDAQERYKSDPELQKGQEQINKTPRWISSHLDSSLQMNETVNYKPAIQI